MNKKNRSKARCAPKKVTINNKGKGQTAQAGLVPVVKFLQRLGMEKKIQGTVTYEREGNNAVYDIVDIVMLTVVGIIGGATGVSGIVTVWADPVLAGIAGWARIPDNSTLGRLFRNFTYQHIIQMETLTHKIRKLAWLQSQGGGTSRLRSRRCMWIDIDSTVKTVYGTQEGTEKGYNPQNKGKLSYHPLLAFSADTKEILQGWLRGGSAYTANGSVDFMKQLLAHLPNKIRIVLRGDSGFFSGELLDFLEKRNHGYLIKVKLKGLTELLAAQEWTPVRKQEGWEQCEFQHKCDCWNKTRMFSAVRILHKENPTHKKKKKQKKKETKGPCYDYFCYVNTEGQSPWQTHKTYGKRATCETWIEEAKNHIGLGHIKTDEFLANCALFHCAVLAYNVIRWMALCSGDDTLCRWEIQTVRAFMIRVAGRLVKSSRQWMLKVSDALLFMEQWAAWAAVGFG